MPKQVRSYSVVDFYALAYLLMTLIARPAIFLIFIKKKYINNNCLIIAVLMVER